MSAELGQLFDTAVHCIDAAHHLTSVRALPALVTGALDILVELDRYTRDLGWTGDPDARSDEPVAAMVRATADLRAHLIAATTHVAAAARLAPPDTAGATPWPRPARHWWPAAICCTRTADPTAGR